MVGHSTTSTQIKLLVVEDSAPLLRCIVGELHEMAEVGEIIEARDKASATEALSTGLPDVVILDVQLPDGSGLDVLRSLRKSGATSGVILFSNLTSRPLAEGCAELKPDFVFHKSADFEDVKSAIRLLGARRRGAGTPGLASSLPD